MVCENRSNDEDAEDTAEEPNRKRRNTGGQTVKRGKLKTAFVTLHSIFQ